jgi:diguanylate cyclase (GGDEF)-like protein
MRSLWKLYLTISLTAMAVFLFVPGDSWAQPVIQVGLGWSAAVVIVLGVRRNRVDFPLPWYLIAGGLFAHSTGIVVEAVLTKVMHSTAFPSLADVFWLALYPLLIGGIAMIIRRRSGRGDWAALVDATTITTGLGLLCWVFLIRPAVLEEADSMIGRVVVIAYPIADVVVLAMVVRLLIGTGNRSTSFALLVSAVIALLAGDIGWAVTYQLGAGPAYLRDHLLDMTLLVAYALFGAAALHPSVREVGEEAQTTSIARLSPWMLALLTTASLIAPCVLLVEVSNDRVTDGVAIAVCSAALFLLVVTRMAQLLRQVEAQAGNLRQLARVDELTGLPNRRAWTSDIAVAIDRARRDRVPLSVAMIDLDHFKRFNDEFGHPAGDRLLKAAAAAWGEQLRAVDRMARYGGEEFILLFNGSNADQATEVLARLRGVTPLGQTFSGGVATWDGSETSDALVARADVALYAAKTSGRDRMVTAGLTAETDMAHIL